MPNLRYTNSRGQEFWINSKGFVGPEFDEQPPSGVYRIIALGDSCTFGFWKMVYPGVLERLLNDSGSSRRFEVINAGIEGYNSTFALGRIRDELLRYRPHLMIIYIGWNDLMKVNPTAQTEHPGLAVVARTIDRLWLTKGLRKLLFYYVRPRLGNPATGPASRTSWSRT